MDIFNTPDWESSQIGNENAMSLFKMKVKAKVFKKLKAKPNVDSVELKLKNNKTVNPERKHALTTANKSRGNDSNNKNFCITNIPKVNHSKSLLKKNGVTKKKNLDIPEKVKHRERVDVKSNVVNNTKQISPDPQLEKKLIKQKIRRSKKRNKFSDNNNSLVSEERNNKPNQHSQKKVKMRKDINVVNCNVDNLSALTSRRNKLINLLSLTPTKTASKTNSLKERMIEKLKASRFRYINEQIYNSEGKEAQKYFRNDPSSFFAYHEGYKQQVSKWPLNPIDVIIKSIRKMPTDFLIADFGCGEAKLAKSVPHTVYSYDLVAVNECVTACDMSKVSLENEKVNVVVFCLSLMGTNIKEYLFEANRVLKNGGILKIAEVESRFETVDIFIDGVKRFGFALTWKDLSHNLFYFLDFKKISKCKPLNKLPTVGLYPCLYKKR